MNADRQPRTSRRAVLAALAAATATTLRGRLVSAQTSAVKVRLVTRIAEPVTPLYYAIKSGLFQRAGLDVEVTASNTGSAATAALLAGDFEFAQTNLLALFAAHLRRVPIVIVAPAVIYTTQYPDGLLQISPDSPIKNAVDLNDKTVGVQGLNDIDALAVRVWIDKNGGDSRTLKYVEMPMSAGGPALLQHRIDAMVIEPPLLGMSIAGGTSKTLVDPMAAIANEFLVSAYIAQSDWASRHRDIVGTFARVMAASTAYVNAHFAETGPLVSELTKVSLSDVAKMKRSIGGTKLDASLIQPCIDVAAKYGAIERGFPARELLLSDTAK